jgi:hypothetical protein
LTARDWPEDKVPEDTFVLNAALDPAGVTARVELKLTLRDVGLNRVTVCAPGLVPPGAPTNSSPVVSTEGPRLVFGGKMFSTMVTICGELETPGALTAICP